MPTNSRVFLKPFIGGLNTEASDVDDMVLNTSDELNCTILPEQMRGRRYGFNIEKDGQWIDVDEEIVTHAVYHWKNADEDKNFIVVQINTKLYFFEDAKPYSLQNIVFVLDLADGYATLDNSNLEPVSITSVNETLFIASKWIYPLVIQYDKESLTFNVEINNLKFRDINGVNDGFAVDTMPTSTEFNQEHLYNLYNQGWDKSIYDPNSHNETHLIPLNNPSSGLFYQTVGRYPANNMQWFIGKQNSGEYNTYDLLNTYFGNTPAPKGHFIIDYINRNRSYSSGIYLNNTGTTPVGEGVYTLEHNLLFRSGQDATMWHVYTGRSGYGFGENYVPSAYYTFKLPAEVTGIVQSFLVSLKDIMNVVVEDPTGGSSLYPVLSYANLENYVFKDNLALDIYGIDGNGTETLIHTATINRYPSVTHSDEWTQYHISFANTTSYSRYSVRLRFPNATWPSFIPFAYSISVSVANPSTGDIELADGLPSIDLLQGAVTDVESFGGRIFYLCGNTILFSQTLSTNNKNYDKCYQEADPTSEEVSDVVATDGGMIQLLSLGRGKALKSFYRGVLVFGDQEVTGVLSNAINLFSADSYDVVKITSAGLIGKYSVVETDNAVFYWSSHGIYIVSIDENNNISANCISLNSIQNWYNNLSQLSKENVIGYYDYANNRIYWFYPTTEDVEKLDGCLVYDLTFNCFMPQRVDAGNVVRDTNNNIVGYLKNLKIYYTDGKSENVTVSNGIVTNSNDDVVGYVQTKYITDCTESYSVSTISPTVYLRAGGDRVVANGSKVLATSLAESEFERKTAGIILVSDTEKFSFGDFNDREFRDWDVSPYESYLVSRPITLGDTYFNKQTPVMQTLFKRTEEYKLKNITKETTEYNLSPYFYSFSSQLMTAYTDVLNAGIFKEAVVSIDLADYESTLNLVSVLVRGHKGSTTEAVALKNVYNVEPVDNYEVSVECDESLINTEYDSFTIEVSVRVYGSSTPVLRSSMNVKTIIVRSDLSEKLFKGYKEQLITGEGILRNVSSTRKSLTLNSVTGILKNASVTIEPNLVPYFPGTTFTWQATSSFAANTGYSTGISSNVTNASPSYSGYNNVRNSYSAWTIFVDNFSFTGGGYLENIKVSYSFTILVPDFYEIAYIKSQDYTTPSGAFIRMRWGWSVNPLSNRWDMVQNGYRPQKDFLHDDYVESRLHIRGRGKAFQVEIRNDENKDFRLTGLNIITRSPQ